MEIEKQKIYNRRNPILTYDLNIDRIAISNRVCFGKKGFKYFVGYEMIMRELCPCI